MQTTYINPFWCEDGNEMESLHLSLCGYYCCHCRDMYVDAPCHKCVLGGTHIKLRNWLKRDVLKDGEKCK